MHGATPGLSWLAPVLIIGVILVLRLRRMRRARRLRLETLWILPAIMAVAVAATLSQVPPRAGGWAWLLGALLLGAGIGWMRGGTMRISIDPATHRLDHRGSPAAILLLGALIVVRLGAKALLRVEAQAWHIDTMLLTDIFLAMALGLVAATRAEMGLRARRLLRDARAARISP